MMTPNIDLNIGVRTGSDWAGRSTAKIPGLTLNPKEDTSFTIPTQYHEMPNHIVRVWNKPSK